jgi:ABC-2 type transport system permease protein
MRSLKFLLEKEFRQIFRNRIILAMMFMIPVVQLLILPLAANYEVKNISLSVIDHDHSTYSQQLLTKIFSSGYFRMAGADASYDEGFKLIEKDQADILFEIPQGFERNLVRENQQQVLMAVNAINGVKANLGAAYLGQILTQFNGMIRAKWIQPGATTSGPMIEIASSNWFNPLMNYNYFMVPGILAILVTMIGSYMAALNIVKEKEIGTIEQINVTPVRKLYFILGKLIPFWLLSMVVFTIGLLIQRFVYGIVPQGNIGLLYLFLSVYSVAILGFGLLVSTYAETQQQAMSVAFFFVMIFLLMSGLFTPIESMPEWAKWISRLTPVSYFIEVMRMIVLKGSGFSDIKNQLGIEVLFALVLNGWAVLNYRKRSS